MICLSCTEETLNEALGTIEKSIKYIDAVEIRADYLLPSEYHLLAEFPSKIKLPCILTFRWPKDGGNDKTLSIAERAEILSKALDGHWAYFDIEDDADSSDEKLLVKKAEDSGVKVIKSFHDFTGVPDNLAQRIIKNSYGNRFIPKAAVMSNSTEDFLKIVQAHKDIQKEIELSNGYSCTNGPFLTDYILVGMGDYGFPSRILAGVFGSMLTFCSSGKAAPGHVNPEIMSELYNYNNLNENTKVFGIIGNPVMHSKSPDIHNPAFQQKNIDAV
ncbi:MAG: type I 3-dehydroquinate dehydratase, partial [Spirochaetales bacterium]|nr:type I 3-dehydroquinate dehydratase [Spirochaetales bacterium]